MTISGYGAADLSQIEVCGLAVEKARCPFPVMGLEAKGEKKGD